jgi:hypothetical protein
MTLDDSVNDSRVVILQEYAKSSLNRQTCRKNKEWTPHKEYLLENVPSLIFRMWDQFKSDVSNYIHFRYQYTQLFCWPVLLRITLKFALYKVHSLKYYEQRDEE